MLEDSALASEQTNWTAANRPRCPNGGQLLQRGGQRIRRLQTRGKQTLTLTRQYGREACPACGQGLFPLDAELALLPGCLTPTLQEHLVQLGTWMPFRSAAQLLSRRRRHALDRDQ